MKIINLPPFAPVLMESTRAIGYSLEAAIADIVDNSISANATEISIKFSPYDAVPYVSILDNGCGMTEQEINDAMRYGSQSSLNERDSNDLGRFGLGLKTASLSQCRCLTVISKHEGKVEARRWDLDEIYKNESWSLISLSADDLKEIPQYIEMLKPLESGTLILWEKLDRMLKGTAVPDKLMNKLMDDVRDHLSLVFHRYIAGESGIKKISIKMNGLEIKPKDPFLIGRSTAFQADEKFIIDGFPVYVSAYMLPHISALSREEKSELGGTEGLTKNQGFYIYRNKRLLVWGTWFRMHRKDELSKLARVRVDVPNALDYLWTLDIKKSTAVPPDDIKDNLRRIVDRISEGSRRTWIFRGKREISGDSNHLWSKIKNREGVTYSLNREHLLLKSLKESLDTKQKKLLEDYLKLAEGYLPLNQLYVDLNNEEQVNIRVEKEEEEEAMRLAMTFLKNIESNPEREIQIRVLLQTDPFCKFKKVVDMLMKELN